MPKTPPLILPSSFPGWFNNNNSNEKSHHHQQQQQEVSIEEFQLLSKELSPFSYSPTDEDELLDGSTTTTSDKPDNNNQSCSKRNSRSRDTSMENLYRKPSSKQNSQQQTINEENSQHYQLEDDDMDEISQRQQDDVTVDTQLLPEDNSFEIAMDGKLVLYQDSS